MQDLFENFPSAESAYIEATGNTHDLAHWKPSHDVVYETGRRVGFYKLRRRDIGAGKQAFARIYKDVCKAWLRGERFKREVIPPRNETGRERLSKFEVHARAMLGRKNINELRALLEG